MSPARAFLAASLALLTVPALAQRVEDAPAVALYTRIDPDSLRTILLADRFGDKASEIEIDATDPEAPALRITLGNGAKYVVHLYDCDRQNPNGCQSLEYVIRLTDGAVTQDQANQFNRDVRYGTAYLDDKSPYLRYDESLRGGVTLEHLRLSQKIFMNVAAQFSKTLSVKPVDVSPPPKK